MDKLNNKMGGAKNSKLNIDAITKMSSKKDNEITEANKSGGSSGKMSLMKAQEVAPNGKI